MQIIHLLVEFSVSIAVNLIADLKQFYLIRKILKKNYARKNICGIVFTQLASVFICVNVGTVSLMTRLVKG